MVITDFPDLPPRPGTAANAAFRRRFYERWGRENALVLGQARRIEFAPYLQQLSIKRAWGGREEYLLPTRRLAVDADHLLILNAGCSYGARIDSPLPVTSLGVFFRPGMAEDVAAAARQTLAQALDRGAETPAVPCGFAEHLRPAEPALEAHLAALRDDALAGALDDETLEERLQALLWSMLEAEPGWRQRSRRLAGASRSMHTELLARVDRAADLIVTLHAEPLTLEAIATAARLSKYHLVRVFRQVHGLTPMAFLARVRARAAQRLVEDSPLGLDEIAMLAGFGCRQTMFRQLRRHCGDGGRALRERAER
jgi:AraC-like DNA-binding protein